MDRFIADILIGWLLSTAAIYCKGAVSNHCGINVGVQRKVINIADTYTVFSLVKHVLAKRRHKHVGLQKLCKLIYFNLNPTICDQAFLLVFRGGWNRERLIVNVYECNPFAVLVCGFTKEIYFICRSSHWYSIPCGDDPIGPEMVTFLRVFSMGEGMNVDVNYFIAGS